MKSASTRVTCRLRTSDGSEFLFSCASDDEMQSWLDRIQYHAGLAPKDQLRYGKGRGGPGLREAGIVIDGEGVR